MPGDHSGGLAELRLTEQAMRLSATDLSEAIRQRTGVPKPGWRTTCRRVGGGVDGAGRREYGAVKLRVAALRHAAVFGCWSPRGLLARGSR